MKKKFYRSRDDKILASLCGGIGKYFKIDSNFIRVIACFIMDCYSSSIATGFNLQEIKSDI